MKENELLKQIFDGKFSEEEIVELALSGKLKENSVIEIATSYYNNDCLLSEDSMYKLLEAGVLKAPEPVLNEVKKKFYRGWDIFPGRDFEIIFSQPREFKPIFLEIRNLYNEYKNLELNKEISLLFTYYQIFERNYNASFNRIRRNISILFMYDLLRLNEKKTESMKILQEKYYVTYEFIRQHVINLIYKRNNDDFGKVRNTIELYMSHNYKHLFHEYTRAPERLLKKQILKLVSFDFYLESTKKYRLIKRSTDRNFHILNAYENLIYVENFDVDEAVTIIKEQFQLKKIKKDILEKFRILENNKQYLPLLFPFKK